MKKHKVGIRIYRDHDIDLVLLYKNPTFGFQKAIKQAIRAYVREQPYFIFVPETFDISDKQFKYSYQAFLDFDEDDDADVLAWLKTLQDRSRNKAIKSVLRGCIIGNLAYGCAKSDDDRLVSNKINVILKDAILSGNISNVIYEPPVRREKRIKNNNKNQEKHLSIRQRSDIIDTSKNSHKYNQKRSNINQKTESIYSTNNKNSLDSININKKSDDSNNSTEFSTSVNNKPLNKMEETIIPEINDINSNNIDAPNSIDDSINDSIDNQNINESNTDSFDVFANVNALLNQF
jgi:hypothetical protein